ncbi:unnamed protein product [Phaedon cochleariae]|uniref:Peptidoglycan binding-like domain-containing protein n=1 Tax=Phaedon cochleariae TaxID=80249 RepID=A0A9N9X4F2_PHACE|nr:unnamed protein product [Phaedon cochleariae]
MHRSPRGFLTAFKQRYLMEYGYMDKSKDGAFALRTEESVRRSLEAMQRFAGLPATGRLDAATKRLLATPRCGLPDLEAERPRRTKRFALHGSKWPYTTLTWR